MSRSVGSAFSNAINQPASERSHIGGDTGEKLRRKLGWGQGGGPSLGHRLIR
jgi:hypothetical protein